MEIIIPLTRGKFTVIDSIDAELSYGLWHLSNGYAVRNNKEIIILHREVMSRKLGRALLADEFVDHRDRNKLNNRRGNLRLATRSQNKQNIGKYDDRTYTAPYKGVAFSQLAQKWVATINVDGKNLYLGNYDTPEQAAQIYNEAAQRFYGEFAVLNALSDPMNVQSTKFRVLRMDNTSGYRGVTQLKNNQKWIARIAYNGKRVHLGAFGTPHEAAQAYNDAAIKYYGEQALLNEIRSA